MERCEVCGFAWEAVSREAVGPRIDAGVARLAGAIETDLAAAARRPSADPARWSMVEYASHVRDVLLHVRDRIVIGLVEDNPDFKPLYRDQRVDLGLYAGDGWDVLEPELRFAAALFARTFARVAESDLARPVQYAYPTLSTRSILWVTQQVVHEVEHHAGDVEANAALV